MPEPTEIDPLILDRYLAGAASAAEAELVLRWEASSERNRATLLALRQEFVEGGAVRTSNTEAAWIALQARTSAHQYGASRRPASATKPRKYGKMRHLWRIAAVLMLAAGGGVIWRVQSSETVLSAPSGQRLSTVLPD